MKSVMKKLLLVALAVLIAQMSANAAKEFLNINITGTRSFQIKVNNVVGQAQLKFVDVEGITLYTARVDHTGSYAKAFDISQLPKGTYYLIIKDRYKTKTVDVKVDSEVSFDMNNTHTVLNPIISEFNGELIVSLFAFKKERMNISIYDNIGNIIETTTLKGKGYIGTKFCLDALKNGTYKVLVDHRKRTFHKEITK